MQAKNTIWAIWCQCSQFEICGQKARKLATFFGFLSKQTIINAKAKLAQLTRY